jgi:outer membrane protein OmpA-like peptidoglycan-associated protein
MKKYVFILFLSITYLYSYTQNLVKDPSFEEYKRCPTHLTQSAKLFPLLEWWLPTKGTPDYMNSCSDEITGYSTPKNKHGFQFPKSGEGYLFAVHSKDDLTEYVQSELTTFLSKNEKYYVELWVSLSESSGLATNRFGVLFSKEKVEDFQSRKALSYVPQVISDTFITEINSWVKISGTFTAQGGEKYITIGCFARDKNDFVKVKQKTKGFFFSKTSGGYFLDDVLVESLKKDTLVTKQYTSELNKPIILKNITFEFGKSRLKESSFAELNKLIVELQANPTYKITLSGHTDNIGQEEDNLKLSEARAKAVAEYLTSKGIASIRITYQGYGSKQPITTNETEQGREQNRRVEFILSQDEK